MSTQKKTSRARVADHFTFATGVVQSADVLRAVAQSDALNGKGAPNTTLMKWVLSEGKRYDFHLDWYVNKVDVRTTPSLEVCALGPDGRINVGSANGDRLERIEGASRYGVERSLSFIGAHAYVVGMGRQVYRRDQPDIWTHVDQGALRQPRKRSVVGFNAIAGRTENELYAVGFAGEIFGFDGRSWRSLDSPTNVILNAVIVRSDGSAFACGQAGVLLNGRGDRWAQIEQDETEEQFWDLAWFGTELYLAADDGLVRMTSDGRFEAVDLPGDGVSNPRSVHSRDGVLLCVGTKSVSWTTDGRTWTELA